MLLRRVRTRGWRGGLRGGSHSLGSQEHVQRAEHHGARSQGGAEFLVTVGHYDDRNGE